MPSSTNPNPFNTLLPTLTKCVMHHWWNHGNTIEVQTFDKWNKYREVWVESFANQLGCLPQGIHDVKNQHHLFHSPQCCPTGMHSHIWAHCCWLPATKTRLTVGGDRIDYLWEVATPTANLAVAKLLFNSIFSTPGAKFFGINIKIFYLNTLLDHFECMQLPQDLILAKIISQCNLHQFADNIWIYIET